MLLGAALWTRRGAGIPAGLLFLGAAYGVSLVSRDPGLDASAVLAAALLFAVSELGFWSLELAIRVEREPSIAARRLVLIAALGLGALGAAGLVAAAAGRAAERGLLLEGVGVVAAIAVLAVLARLARRLE